MARKQHARARPAPSAAKALIEYAHDEQKREQRENCAVCALPDEVRLQIKDAPRKKIPGRVVRDWLMREHRIDIPEAAFKGHSAGHHE